MAQQAFVHQTSPQSLQRIVSRATYPSFATILVELEVLTAFELLVDLFQTVHLECWVVVATARSIFMQASYCRCQSSLAILSLSDSPGSSV